MNWAAALRVPVVVVTGDPGTRQGPSSRGRRQISAISYRRGRRTRGRGGGQPHLGGGRASPGVGVGRFVPAASQPSRRALQRQEAQTCGARQELGEGGRRERVQGSAEPRRLARAKRGPLSAGSWGTWRRLRHHPAQSSHEEQRQKHQPEGANRVHGVRIQTVPARGAEEGAQRPASKRSGFQRAVGAAAFVGLAALRRRDRAERAFVGAWGGWFMPRELLWPAASPALESVCGERNSAKLNLAPNFLLWLPFGDDPGWLDVPEMGSRQAWGKWLGGVIAQGSNLQHHAEAWIHTLKAQSLCLWQVESVKLLGPKEAGLITLDPFIRLE